MPLTVFPGSNQWLLGANQYTGSRDVNLSLPTHLSNNYLDKPELEPNETPVLRNAWFEEIRLMTLTKPSRLSWRFPTIETIMESRTNSTGQVNDV